MNEKIGGKETYMQREIHEECGVFGVYDPAGAADVATEAYYALFALQHRGQESCGIAVNRDGVIRVHKDLGLVRDVFTKENLAALGHGQIAVGHTRYSTTGAVSRENAQPLVVSHVNGQMAVAHNGNLTNAAELRRQLELSGAIFHTTNDTEVISYLITRERLHADSIEQAVERAMPKLLGAYSLVIMSPRKLIAARDAVGFRPLCMGRMPGGKVVFASETCALDSIGAEFVRDVEAGEIVVVDDQGVRSIRTHCRARAHTCLFEFIYFARPDSVIEGQSVHEARLQAGRDPGGGASDRSGCGDWRAGFRARRGAWLCAGVRDSLSNRLCEEPIHRAHLHPAGAGTAGNAVRIKLNALASVVRGKRVVMVDDSIVRGTTSARIVTLLREAGAREVHMRVSAPPFISPCYYGTDIDAKEKLIACQMSEQEICRVIGADSLGYLSVAGARQIAAGAHCDFCDGCFTGKYPAATPREIDKDKFEQPANITE